MKILICGNGPSLKKTLENLNLDNYDYVLRMNNWQPIPDQNNRCDIWCTTFWYDIPDNQILINKDKIIWDVFLYGGCYRFKKSRIEKVKQILKKTPEYFLKRLEFNNFRRNVIKIASPSCGMYAIYIALKQKMKVHIAGFDFFESENMHYFEDKKKVRKIPHKSNVEKKFIQKLHFDKKIKIL
jgi:hypothetical protein